MFESLAMLRAPAKDQSPLGIEEMLMPGGGLVGMKLYIRIGKKWTEGKDGLRRGLARG